MKGFRPQHEFNEKDEIAKIRKSSKEEIINQAIKFHLQGNISEAAKYYEYLLDHGFNDPRVFSNYGVIFKQTGKVDKAIELLNKSIILFPGIAETHSYLGSFLKDLGKFKEAEVSIRKAIEIDPNYAMAYSNLGNVLRDSGKLQDAETSQRKAIEIDPKLEGAHSNLGIILKDLGKLREAEISIRKAISINPNYAMAHCNLGSILKDIGKLQEAEISTRKAIEINSNYAMAHCNLGSILKDLGKLKEAEISTRKAIEISSNYAMAHSNLGSILIYLGKLKEAEISIRKAIEIDANLSRHYFVLSTLKSSEDNKVWQDLLFSESVLKNKIPNEKVDIYFARANKLHREGRYSESANYLQLANNIKLSLNPSNSDTLIERSKALCLESDEHDFKCKDDSSYPQSIFIVGMPRSGSTLAESIITMNNDVDDLGEVNILEESFLEWKKLGRINHKCSLAELYFKKVNAIKNQGKITTNKFLGNYQYAGIIINQINNAKIIHCFRHPLDNILSIYRAHFAKGNQYASSLHECSRIYLSQEEIMAQYKKRFRSKIYDLNYDLLVTKPNNEIRKLINWLGWEWNDSYLSPHLNTRSVRTASSVQVRSPINSESIGVWKNYIDMLKPAIEGLESNKKNKIYSS